MSRRRAELVPANGTGALTIRPWSPPPSLDAKQERPLADVEAARLAKTLGCKPDDLLGPRRVGFVITFTRDAVTEGPP